MHELTIGVFDSGLGGLTAMKNLMKLFPHTDIIYFGDTGHMPYGGRSNEQLLYMARKNIAFLESEGSKTILAACGTISSVALHIVERETETPLFGTAFPTAETAVRETKNKVIGFIATEASVKSGFTKSLIKKLMPEAEVIDRACPKFVPMVEAGNCSHESLEVMETVHEYLAEIKNAGADILILGCTHYPMLEEAIAKYMGEDVKLLSCGGEAANALGKELFENGYTPDTTRKGKRTYYTSGSAEVFKELGSKFIGNELDGEVIELKPYELIEG